MKRLNFTTWIQTPRIGSSFHLSVTPWTPNETLTSLRQAFDELLDSPQKCLLFDCETKGELNKRSRFIYSILWCTTLLALEEAYYHAPEYHPAKTGTQLEMVRQPPIWDKHFWYFSELCPFYQFNQTCKIQSLKPL